MNVKEMLGKFGKSLCVGFGAGFAVWAIVLVLNAFFTLVGVSVAFSMPAGWEWMLNPFVLGTVLGVLKVVVDVLRE